jgi:microcystin-dependent protein
MKTINSLVRVSLFLLLSILCSNAQVGVNTTNPHPSAALDVQSSNQGLLIPRIPTAARIAMTNMANSLLVYDTDMQMYFYYQAADNTWYSLNAWTSEVTVSGGNTDTTTYTLSKVGIGTTTPTQALTVAGNTQVSGNVVVGGNTQVTGTVTGSKLYGEGAVPVGAIMMWSGNPSSLPVGWALCDGQLGRPDLRGRFVVGYDNADVDYNATQKVGPVYTDADGSSTGTNTQDAKQVRLTGAQSGTSAHTHTVNDPGHTHSFNYERPPNSDDLAGGKKSSVTHNQGANGTTNSSTTGITINPSSPQNATTPIENRPPYYVLAYIIKIAY